MSSLGSMVKRGHELLEAARKKETFELSGPKLNEVPENTLWVESQTQSLCTQLSNVISEPITGRRDTITRGEWMENLRLVWLLAGRGKVPPHMGVLSDKGPCLYPEEAIYLMHLGVLEVIYGQVPLSIQAAHQVMLCNAGDMDKYLAYTYFAAQGYKVHRHQPHLAPTYYEKQIRLGQQVESCQRKRISLDAPPNVVSESIDWNSNIDSLIAFYKGGNMWSGNNASDSNTLPVPEPEPFPHSPVPEDKVELELADFYASITEGQHSVSSAETQSSTEGLPNLSTENEINYDEEKQQILNCFPSVTGKTVVTVSILEDHLLPEGCVLSRKCYEINLNSLNFYSKYDVRPEDDGHAGLSHQESSHTRYHFSRRKYKRPRNSPGNCIISQRNVNGHVYPSGPYMSVWEAPHESGCSQFRFNGDHYQDPDRHLQALDAPCEFPYWKTGNFRQKKLRQNDKFPSCLNRDVAGRVKSWKEYKSRVKKMKETACLRRGPAAVLWRGKTVPLLRPSEYVSYESMLKVCQLSTEVTYEHNFPAPPEEKLKMTYDAYLPSLSYKPSKPPPPSLRVVVGEDGRLPSPAALMELYSRIADKIPIIISFVANGKVRCYSFTPYSAVPFNADQ